MRILGALTALLIYASAPAHAQQPNDPYAEDLQKVASEQAAVEKAELSKEAKTLMFAQGCGAIQGSMAAAVVQIHTYDFITAHHPYPPQGFIAEIKSIGSEGTAQSKEPAACDYWHNDPELVSELRHWAYAVLRSRSPY